MQSTYKKTTAHGQVHTETSAEYMLSDYQGDIKKVLSSEARIIPTGKFMSNSEVQFAGSVAYEILYADTEGHLTSAQFSSEYEFATPVDEHAEDAVADVYMNGLSVRLSGPRKISVKGHVCAHVCSFSHETVETVGDALSEELSPQLKEATLPVRYTVCAEDVERTYTDAVSMSDYAEEHVQILSQGAETTVRGITTEEGAISFVAETCMYALVSTEEGTARCLRRTVSTEERVDVEGMHVQMKPTVQAVSCVAHAMTETDAEGTETVRMSAQVMYRVRAEANAPLTVLTDGYLCKDETDNTYADFPYEEYLDTQTICVTVEGEAALAEVGCDALREILYTSAALKSLHATVDDMGHLKVEGELQAHAIGVQAESGDNCFFPIKVALPFSKTEDTGASYPQGAAVEVSGTVQHMEGTLDADRILLRGECVIRVRVFAERTCRYLSSMQRTGQTCAASLGSVITVYYPTATDTLWDIARTYRTTVESLAEDNGLDVAACMADGTPLPVQRLLILR